MGYINRTSPRRKKFLKPWCGSWRVVKALSDVTYRIEEEGWKPGKHHQRKVVHFNDLLIHGKPSQLTSAGHAEDTPQAENLRDGQQPSQGTLVDSGDVELEWLENPVALARGLSSLPGA